ncbi:MAG: NAD-dependent malic enzyme [Gammaproteobacteria bacterium]
MQNYNIKTENQKKYLETSLTGRNLLRTPHLNKDTAFTAEERKDFSLQGLLPNHVESLQEQVERAYKQYKSYESALQKNIFLHDLRSHNATLFYRLVLDHTEEITPILYTPVVGDAVKAYSKEYRYPYNAFYISYPDRNNIAEILRQRDFKDIDLIVVTDGERILGLGDQGVGGVHIPVAKLMLYSLFGGIDPMRTLPIVLDVGTNNKDHSNDPNYLGWRHPRIRGQEYDLFIDQVVAAVKQEFPNIFFHWEDFGRDNAILNLARFRDKLCSFNDDIQGTAVITLAALFAAMKITKGNWKDQRIVSVGGGAAGLGIADLMCIDMMENGSTLEESRKRFWMLNSQGLLTTASTKTIPSQKPYLRDASEIDNWQVADKNHVTLAEVVKHVKPTILIGCSGVGGIFTEEIVKEMAKHTARPIIFPLSNPTANCEATPENLIKWTNGSVLIATGSPFQPVSHAGKQIRIAQCNNAFAFPGIGLGVISTKATKVSDAMLWQAAKAIGEATIKLLPPGEEALLPRINKAPDVAIEVALAVANQAVKEKYTTLKAEDITKELLEKHIWRPEYLPYSIKR